MSQSNPNQFTFYSYTNYYGVKMYAIGHMDAMPFKYDNIILTGTISQCKSRYNESL